jgi:polynucleotide 5'-hydroxyl-kinase GRC3/NOL9
MTTAPGWARALERAARSRLTLVLGAVDTGKTRLTTYLANGLLAAGFRVAVVDADLGQSEIGPPTTIGLGSPTRALAGLGDADVLALSFVGSTSPQGHVSSTVVGTGRMAARAAAAFERVLVDTSGLIEGELGRALKRGKIARLDPDLVICLEREAECDTILQPLAASVRPEILRLPVGAEARRRSAGERRRHREAAFEAYFRRAASRRLAVDGLALRFTDDRPGALTLDDLAGAEGALAGLDDAGGETLGLAVVRAVDVAARALLVDTPVSDSPVAGLRLSRHAIVSSNHEVIR